MQVKSLPEIFLTQLLAMILAHFRHTLHDIHERIKLFVLDKTKHLEDL